MQALENLDVIPPAKVAVQLDELTDREEERRRLEEAFFKTQDGSFFAKLKIIDALEVNVKPMDGLDESDLTHKVQFTYEVEDFDGENLWL